MGRLRRIVLITVFFLGCALPLFAQVTGLTPILAPSANFALGSQNGLVMEFQVTGGASADSATAFNFYNSLVAPPAAQGGTGLPFDISTFKLWYQSGSSIFSPVLSTPVSVSATAPLSWGTLSANLPVTAGGYLFVTADITATAQVGDIFELLMTPASATFSSGLNYPVSGSVTNTSPQTIVSVGTATSLTLVNVPNGNLTRGTNDNLVLQLTVATSGTAVFQTIQVANQLSAIFSTDISNVKLWYQPGGGTFSASTAVELANLSNTGSKTWGMSGALNWNVNNGDGLYVTADILGGATLGNACQFSVPANGVVFSNGSLPPAALVNGGVQTIPLPTATPSFTSTHTLTPTPTFTYTYTFTPTATNTPAIPNLFSLSPSSGGTGGGYNINLTGSNLLGPVTVTIGGAAASVVSDSTGSIVVTVPPGAGANLAVVAVVNGYSSNSIQFSYLPPTISSLNPTSGLVAGGYPVTISGSNFYPGALVTFNGVNAPLSGASVTQLIVTAPAGSAGTAPVTVAVAGQTATNAAFIYLVPTPTFTFTPTNSFTPTNTPTNTLSPTPTFTPTSTNTPLPTHTFTPTNTPTFTPTGSVTPTPTPNIPLYLDQNYFDPGKGGLGMDVRVDQMGEVKLEVFNLAGQLVRVIVDLTESPGNYRFNWDGRNNTGAVVGNGLYLVVIRTPSGNRIQKVIILK